MLCHWEWALRVYSLTLYPVPSLLVSKKIIINSIFETVCKFYTFPYTYYFYIAEYIEVLPYAKDMQALLLATADRKMC